jgi:hypothetical protein
MGRRGTDRNGREAFGTCCSIAESIGDRFRQVCGRIADDSAAIRAGRAGFGTDPAAKVPIECDALGIRYRVDGLGVW